jgi:benzodiazapine receptor
MGNSLLRWLNAIGLIGVIAANWLVNAIPLNGLTTVRISAMFPVQITPAPYAFSIWGLIYALLIGYVIVQFLPGKRGHEEISQIGPWFIVSCSFNIGWILLWHNLLIGSSVVVMLCLLLCLAAIYRRTRRFGWSPDPLIRWLVQVPFSIYLAWVAFAAIQNISVALYAVQWNRFGLPGTVWTICLMLLAAVLSLIIGYIFRDPAYILVPVWAFIAIGVDNQGNEFIVNMAWAASALLTVFALCLLGIGKPDWQRVPAK